MKQQERRLLRHLLQRALRGNVEAFGEFYERMLDRMFRYLFYRTGHFQDAEDLTEEVFLKAWEALQDAQELPEHPEAWLYRIAHNTVVDYYRTRKPLVSLEEIRLPQTITTSETPEEIALSAERFQVLMENLHRLPPIYQQVLICRFIQGLSHKEVAQVLGTNENHARILQYRALKRLREEMFKEEGDG